VKSNIDKLLKSADYKSADD